MEVSFYQDILSILRFLVVERIDKDIFRAIGSCPGWYLQIKPGRTLGEEAFHPIDIFPFLEGFLSDAEYFWNNTENGHLRSEHWIETGPAGTECALEAVAIAKQGKKLLLIGSAGYSLTEKQSVIQKGRELRLSYDRLKKLEFDLKESEERFRDLFENATDLIQSVSPDGHFLYVNRAWRETLGYQAADISELTVFDIIHPISLEHCKDYFQRVLKGEDAEEMKATFVTKDGRKIYVEGNVNCRFKNGKPVSTRAIFRNVTKRYETEKALKESEERLRTLINTAVDGIITIDHGAAIQSFNPSAERLFGYKAEEIVGKNVKILIPEPYRRHHDSYIKNYLETGEAKVIGIGREVVGRRKDGRTLPLYLSVSEMVVKGQRVFTGFLRDISELKVAEEALKKAKEEAEAANLAKSDFLASMSHEIRTPMNAIIGMAELLWETLETDEQREYVQIFRKAGENLLDIINDILDLSKVEAGKIELDHVEFELSDVLDRTCKILGIRAHEKGIALSCRIMPDVPNALIGDPVRLRQILINLIGNSIKFTHHGQVQVEVGNADDTSEDMVTGEEKRLRKGGNARLLFSIKDTGIGIPKNKITHIFDRFTQADSSTTREYGGTGLGLPISKRLAELMGGRLWVESEEESGSTFYFTATLKERIGKALPVVPLAPDHIDGIHPLNILLVDDAKDNRMLVQAYLKKTPHQVETAENGEIAVEKFRSGKFDFVFMDMQMPVMDGYTATRKIREWEREQQIDERPIIALTAHALKEYEQKSIEAGCTAHLSKPIKKMDLLAAIEKYGTINNK
jgi:PAS domain S-box-containing protein